MPLIRSLRGTARGWLSRHPLVPALLAGFALRAATLVRPHAYFADEVFQYLEPAHRLVFGYGVVPWEYRYGIRSWLVPDALAAPMALGAWLAPGGGAYLLLPKLALVLFSLVAIGAAFAIGRRVSPAHAAFAAFGIAIWSETAYFGTQALTEAIAIPPILAAVALGARPGGGRRAMLAGFLFALAATIRFQYGPAIAVLALACAGRDPRRWLALAGGGAAALAIGAAIDLAAGQAPFGWLAASVRENIGHGRSLLWVEGPGFYPRALMASWGIWSAPVLALAVIGARRFPGLFLAALVNVAVHSAIAHKEYRYILLSTTILVLLAAISTVDVVRWRRGARRGLGVAAILWIIASASSALPPFTAYYRGAMTPKLEAFAYLRGVPRLCGVALADIHWSETGGYAYLHRRVPLYVPDEGRGHRLPAGAAAGYDAIVAPPGGADVPPGFARDRCFGAGGRFPEQAACVYRRAGGCDPAAAARQEIARVLLRADR